MRLNFDAQEFVATLQAPKSHLYFSRVTDTTDGGCVYRLEEGRSVSVTTNEPVTCNKVTDPEDHPFVVWGNGLAALKIFFESGDTLRAYLMAHPGDPDHFEDDYTHHS